MLSPAKTILRPRSPPSFGLVLAAAGGIGEDAEVCRRRVCSSCPPGSSGAGASASGWGAIVSFSPSTHASNGSHEREESGTAERKPHSGANGARRGAGENGSGTAKSPTCAGLACGCSKQRRMHSGKYCSASRESRTRGGRVSLLSSRRPLRRLMNELSALANEFNTVTRGCRPPSASRECR